LIFDYLSRSKAGDTAGFRVHEVDFVLNGILKPQGVPFPFPFYNIYSKIGIFLFVLSEIYESRNEKENSIKIIELCNTD
jgi:hypothetical protein